MDSRLDQADSLSRLERAQVKFIRASLQPGMLDQGIT